MNDIGSDKKTGTSTREARIDELIDRISAGEALTTICEDEHMPPRRTVYNWINADSELKAAYETARKERADLIFEETIKLADEATPETVAVQRLRVDTRKWAAAKLNPKVYSEKHVHLGDDNGDAIQHAHTIIRKIVKPSA